MLRLRQSLRRMGIAAGQTERVLRRRWKRSSLKPPVQSPAVLVEKVSLRDAVTMSHCEGCAAETTPTPARGKHPAGDWATNNLQDRSKTLWQKNRVTFLAI